MSVASTRPPASLSCLVPLCAALPPPPLRAQRQATLLAKLRNVLEITDEENIRIQARAAAGEEAREGPKHASDLPPLAPPPAAAPGAHALLPTLPTAAAQMEVQAEANQHKKKKR